MDFLTGTGIILLRRLAIIAVAFVIGLLIIRMLRKKKKN